MLLSLDIFLDQGREDYSTIDSSWRQVTRDAYGEPSQEALYRLRCFPYFFNRRINLIPAQIPSQASITVFSCEADRGVVRRCRGCPHSAGSAVSCFILKSFMTLDSQPFFCAFSRFAYTRDFSPLRTYDTFSLCILRVFHLPRTPSTYFITGLSPFSLPPRPLPSPVYHLIQ